MIEKYYEAEEDPGAAIRQSLLWSWAEVLRQAHDRVRPEIVRQIDEELSFATDTEASTIGDEDVERIVARMMGLVFVEVHSAFETRENVTPEPRQIPDTNGMNQGIDHRPRDLQTRFPESESAGLSPLGDPSLLVGLLDSHAEIEDEVSFETLSTAGSNAQEESSDKENEKP
jgi:hypothetical protein